MKSVTVTSEMFKTDFPEFSETPDNTVTLFIKQAEIYIDPVDSGPASAEARQLMIELMTAHLLTIQSKIEKGSISSNLRMRSSHVEDVRVDYYDIPFAKGDGYDYWLSLSPYGLRLLALFDSFSFLYYHGGSPVRVLG